RDRAGRARREPAGRRRRCAAARRARRRRVRRDRPAPSVGRVDLAPHGARQDAAGARACRDRQARGVAVGARRRRARSAIVSSLSWHRPGAAMIVADLLAELVAFPTQQAGPERGAGDERALCEYLAPLLRSAGADDVTVEAATRSDGSAGAYVFARWGTPTRIINVHLD